MTKQTAYWQLWTGSPFIRSKGLYQIVDIGKVDDIPQPWAARKRQEKMIKLGQKIEPSKFRMTANTRTSKTSVSSVKLASPRPRQQTQDRYFYMR